jgi:hypothetical protein
MPVYRFKRPARGSRSDILLTRESIGVYDCENLFDLQPLTGTNPLDR